MSETDPMEVFKHNGRKLRRKSCTTSALLANKVDIGPRKALLTELSTTSSLPPRTVILPPPKPPSQLLHKRGRPLSAKGRPQTMVTSLNQADGYRLHFALQHSNPLPPISQPIDGRPDPQPLEDKLTEVDSAVDLEYSSLCGEPAPLRVPANVEISRSHSSYEQDNEPTQHSYTSQQHQDISTGSTVELRLRLLSGKCIDAEFPVSTTLLKVCKYAQTNSSSDLSSCIICSNEIPRREFHDKTVTLKEAGIVVRTMLYFIEA